MRGTPASGIGAATVAPDLDEGTGGCSRPVTAAPAVASCASAAAGSFRLPREHPTCKKRAAISMHAATVRAPGLLLGRSNGRWTAVERLPMALDSSAVGFTTAPSRFAYDWKTVVLYALGVGATRDELDYLYEGRGPRVYPSFGVCPVMPAVMECLARTGGDFATVVHGGQSLRVHRPIPPSGELVTTATLRGMYDMKKLAQVVVDTESRLQGGELLFETTWSIIYRGAGGFSGPRPPKAESVELPEDKPVDLHLELATRPEQALLYRLSGDLNPLHADPAFAAKAGFTQGPILHGLCTYGFVARAIVQTACGGDATKLRRLDGQFRRPVWPGDTIVVDGWRLDAGVVAARVGVKERPEPVMTGVFAHVAG
jgi:acyl dehydratase